VQEKHSAASLIISQASGLHRSGTTCLSCFQQGQFTKIIERYRRHFTIVTREDQDVTKDLIILASLIVEPMTSTLPATIE